MKIASFNINNINRRLSNLLHWLHKAQPDIVCLQELKATDAEFPADAIGQAGYHAVWRGEQRWNGVAILARWAPVVTRMDLPGDAADGQCRYLEAAVNGVLVASIYAPNGNPQHGPKFDYKLAWLKRLNAQIFVSRSSRRPGPSRRPSGSLEQGQCLSCRSLGQPRLHGKMQASFDPQRQCSCFVLKLVWPSPLRGRSLVLDGLG
jgi:hypothetical protein